MSPVSELSALKYEVLALKLANLQLQIRELQSAARNVQVEGNAHLAAMRTDAGVSAEATYDPQQRVFHETTVMK